MSDYCIIHYDDRRICCRKIIDQPIPSKTLEDPIHLLVVKDINERSAIGYERYGTFLKASNGRDHLIDAYQEAIDLVMYLRAEIEKRNGNESN